MFPWNRKEVYLGLSMKEFNKVCDILAANKIQYDSRAVNHNANWSGTRGRMGSAGVTLAYENQYYVYVKKQDYENAKYLLTK